MNILYFVNTWPKLSESFILNEVYELEERGNNIAIFAKHRGNENIGHVELNELSLPVRYAKTPMQPSDGLDLLSPKLLSLPVLRTLCWQHSPREHAWILHLARQCIDFINTLDYETDIIHAHFASIEKLGAAYAAAYFGIPFTVTPHAFEIFSDGKRMSARKVLKCADHIIAPSQYNSNYIENDLNISAPTDVIPATTRAEKFNPTSQSNQFRLLTVGRLVEKKGYTYAIDAVAELVEDYPNLRYHIIGDGKLKSELRDQVKNRGITEHVTFLGHVDDETLHAELDTATVFVLPCVIAENGDRDAMPVVLKEAMAMETACVSTTVSAIPELIQDGENGLLVPPNNVDDLSKAINRLLDSPQLRQKLAIQGRTTIETKFDITSTVLKLENAFKNTIRTNNG